jgi:hypothetical protein
MDERLIRLFGKFGYRRIWEWLGRVPFSWESKSRMKCAVSRYWGDLAGVDLRTWIVNLIVRS